ncbi:MOSC domain-containing protein [Microbacterium amylolyticum]|uniref:MOSC domain-containing protein YiiM n=1 Tax=Microbacterium amylolyticum TaxID=936337 RepID=A0ABS4ZJC2_9MICO|nr:MOSC domain-containing protein [Microbacterium amylolyticum]MBP2437297.1 MOSC domain-containing protein YiiM [Microbacterium amylolyticum]
MAAPTVLAVCVVHQLLPDSGAVGATGIDKRPVDGAVKVGKLGVYADVQADRKHHGGEKQAVYAYAQEDANWWAAELGRDIPFGTLFGENLRTTGIDVSNVRVGEQWRIGTVMLEATSPRNPCMTFARRMGLEKAGWVKRFAQEGRLGTYFRVLKTGTITAGDTIEVVHVPEGAPTVREAAAGPGRATD